MRKILVALAFGAASIVAPFAADTAHAAPVQHALPPNICVASGGNYWSCLYRWYLCGPYVYNRFTGFSCDACRWCLG